MAVPKLRMPSVKQFEARMRDYKKEQEKLEREEKARPLKEFMAAAKQAGFTIKQSIFMWNWLATSDHQHWDGRIGISK